jgi:hypothetical protein
MIFWTIKWVIISIIIIATCHNIYIYLIDSLTVPKTRDLIKNPEQRYAEMLSSEVPVEESVVVGDEVDKMKDELQSFMNNLSQRV